ncbi:MFS transporter [Stackebrandtia nassauensis]|uniref:Major facilitator superfamily MFS_1 n=1 Tax=Stackebrandtia nassauensis (strain DSM 44728 / CIP 108903 / NRRL B-16338 / NBRC 102104 / LLR-40K-21) TaxID=446470 RepID=D3PZH0_STANL|nr:MFS transporter [Stackebrandtia nassauensis]ADD41644.1 major facilitator superfamily MFS_1 [Stackebrandtia nassauensis DSM 44728]
MNTTGETLPPPKATSREWIGLAVLALPTLLLSLDLSVLYLALPQLSADLRPSSTQTLWILDSYGFMIAGFLVTMGTLGDRIGRRKLLLIGAAAFGVASLAAAYATSPEMLIAARVLLGVAGATQMPSLLALIGNMFKDAKQRSFAIATWMSCFMGGMAVGPVIGGFLLENFWWGSVFLIGVPVMVVLLVAGPFLLPEYKDGSAGRVDLISVALSLLAILPFIYGLKEIAKTGVQVSHVAAIAVGLAFGAVFVRRQRRLKDPLLDLRLFGNRTFTAALTSMSLGAGIMGGVMFLFNQYLQMVAGLSPLEAGLWMVPPSVFMITITQITPAIARAMRRDHLIATGFALAAVGIFILAQVEADSGPLMLVAGMTVTAMGMAPLGMVCTDIVIGSVPPEKAGSASSMSETSAEFGIAMGVAVFGSLATAVYRGGIDIPEGTPDAAAAAARESLPGAAEAAKDLPGQLGAGLLDTAREAFTSGLGVVATVGAIVMVGLAALGLVMFRERKTTPEPTAEQQDRETELVNA